MRLASLLLLFTLICTIAHGDDALVKPLEIGAAAPAFSLVGTDDKTYTLASFKDAKVLVLVFTCNHCPTAQAYAGRIQKLNDDFRDKGVALVAINPNDPQALRLDELAYTEYSDSLAEMKLRAADNHTTYPYLFDGGKQEAAHAFGATATPQVFIFDAERKLRYRGHVDDAETGGDPKSEDARKAIESLLAGKPVPVETTTCLGCSTKWSDKHKAATESLTKWNSEPVSLGEIDAKGIADLIKNGTKNLRLINFYATWCGPCNAEFPDLVEIYRTYRGRNFEMIFLSLDDPSTKDRVAPFLEKYHASAKSFLITETDSQKLVDAIDKDWQGEIPLTMLVSPEGKVVYKTIGTIDPVEVKKEILKQLGRKL